MKKVLDFDALSLLDSHGFISLFGEIDGNVSRHTVEYIFAHNLISKPVNYISILINSSGGSLTDAFAIIDAMTHSKIPIRTIGMGEICSAGLMIFMAGAKTHRKLMPNTTVMSHQWSSESSGKRFELISAQVGFEQTSLRVNRHYSKYSLLNEENIQKILLPAHDAYLTPAEAIEYGLADGLF